MTWIEQSLSDHIVSTLATVCLAVGTELTERQGARRRWNTQNSLTDYIVVAVVVVWWALVVRRRLPRLIRYWLTKYVETETLKTQLCTSANIATNNNYVY